MAKKGGCLKSIIFFFIAVVVILVLIGAVILIYFAITLPDIEELTPSPVAETSKVYSLDGSLITEFHAEENREIINFDQMSEYLKKAVVAVEDKRFYEHQGVDYIRIIGALIADIRAGDLEQGGSTITQQYVKNVYFGFEKTFRRKINEAAVSVQLERNYTKDKILEMYLNTIYFGAGTYGIQKASQIYFGIDASELDLAQSAMLAGLIRAPEIYSPYNDIEKALSRRNLVLKLMHEQQLITNQEYLEALTEEIVLNSQELAYSPSEDNIAPYFIDLVKQRLYEKKFTDYDVFKGGLRIYTTLDTELQKKASEALGSVLTPEIEPSYSLISVDPSNGYIYALIGGDDYSKSKFNIATQGKRQPGSIFKTLVLMESLRQNYSPNDRYDPNGPITIELEGAPDWNVDNYGGAKYEGDMSVIDATIKSVNVVYAQLMMEVGPENVEDLASAMQIEDIGSNPAIALGGLEIGVTPLDVSKIFSTLASGGMYYEPVCILKITDAKGNILYEYDKEANESNKRIMEEPMAYYATQILSRVIKEGTGRGADIGRPAAGKTGTTSDYRDAWFGGYTPELTTVVWMGHEQSSIPMEPIDGRQVVGGSFPADIWKVYMSSAMEGRPVKDFERPDDELVDIQICTESGLLPALWCPEDKIEYRIFIKGKEPNEYCDIHDEISVPDLIGMDEDAAASLLESLQIDVIREYEFNSDTGQGTVFAQEPSSGTIIRSLEGQRVEVKIIVSKGIESFGMPDVTGLDKDMAQEIVISYGLEVKEIIYGFNSDQPLDHVYGQDPASTASVTKGQQVTLFVSKGQDPFLVIPSVIGMETQAAISTLSGSGFINVVIVEEENDAVMGTVFEQIPQAQTSYERSKEIVLKVSKGIEVPDLTGMDLEEAIQILEDIGLGIEVVPEGQLEGTVADQSPEPGTYLSSQDIVTITLEEVIIETPVEEENGAEEDQEETGG